MWRLGGGYVAAMWRLLAAVWRLGGRYVTAVWRDAGDDGGMPATTARRRRAALLGVCR
jgi:hypothetical protein